MAYIKVNNGGGGGLTRTTILIPTEQEQTAGQAELWSPYAQFDYIGVKYEYHDAATTVQAEAIMPAADFAKTYMSASGITELTKFNALTFGGWFKSAFFARAMWLSDANTVAWNSYAYKAYAEINSDAPDYVDDFKIVEVFGLK